MILSLTVALSRALGQSVGQIKVTRLWILGVHACSRVIIHAAMFLKLQYPARLLTGGL
jgi:hypothetical protein